MAFTNTLNQIAEAYVSRDPRFAPLVPRPAVQPKGWAFTLKTRVNDLAITILNAICSFSKVYQNLKMKHAEQYVVRADLKESHEHIHAFVVSWDSFIRAQKNYDSTRATLWKEGVAAGHCNLSRMEKIQVGLKNIFRHSKTNQKRIDDLMKQLESAREEMGKHRKDNIASHDALENMLVRADVEAIALLDKDLQAIFCSANLTDEEQTLKYLYDRDLKEDISVAWRQRFRDAQDRLEMAQNNERININLLNGREVTEHKKAEIRNEMGKVQKEMKEARTYHEKIRNKLIKAELIDSRFPRNQKIQVRKPAEVTERFYIRHQKGILKALGAATTLLLMGAAANRWLVGKEPVGSEPQGLPVGSEPQELPVGSEPQELPVGSEPQGLPVDRELLQELMDQAKPYLPWVGAGTFSLLAMLAFCCCCKKKRVRVGEDQKIKMPIPRETVEDQSNGTFGGAINGDANAFFAEASATATDVQGDDHDGVGTYNRLPPVPENIYTSPGAVDGAGKYFGNYKIVELLRQQRQGQVASSFNGSDE